MHKLRMAIIGCRNMGQKHLRTLREDFADQVEVVGILNSSLESTKACAVKFDIPYFTNIEEINKNKVDAAIVATPGITHAKIGEKLLLRGIPCLIEKPIATTVYGCNKLMKAAKEGGSLVMVGHTENYNPAVIRLKEELDTHVISINGIRTSRNSANKTGISAVQELMIHDLAIVYSLLGKNVDKFTIYKRSDLSWENHAIVGMTYKDGAMVNLEALREDLEIKRFMDIKDERGNTFHIDFVERRLLKNGEVLTEGGVPLKNELADFISCIKNGTTPLVGAQEAKGIVELCLKLEKGMTVKTSILKTKQISY